MPANMA